MTAPNFSSLLQSFFTSRLMQQRQASPHTIGSYRDSFRLLLQFAQKRLGVAPQRLAFEQFDAPLITAFLEEMQTHRGISTISRNLRLTAIRSFFRYASYEMPTHAAQIQRVLSIPNKRCTRTQIGFLTTEEVDALLRAPDLCSRSGRRDHALMRLAVQTGLRLSEITGLCRRDVCLSSGAHVRVVGKGRKERSTPLTKATSDVLRAWLREIETSDAAIVFLSARGARLSADGVQYLLSKHVAKARKACASLGTKRVTTHVLRHRTTAMHLLQSGVDISVIALWLGHERPTTTHMYVEADLAMKDRALARLQEPTARARRYRAPEELLQFLKTL